MANPFLFLAPLNGSLAFQDRAGGGTLTGSGAVRYQAASGARTNLMTNPRFGAGVNTGWTTNGATATNTIVSDADFGGYAINCEATTVVHGFQTNSSQVIRVTKGVVHYLSFDIKWVSGATDWDCIVLYLDADGTQVASEVISASFTITGSVQRITGSFTPSGTGVHQVRVQVRRDSTAVSVIRASNFLVSESSDTTYFAGSTGGAWLNPITGILGTAHASPSVSLAVAWVEEGTTNLLINPSAESTITSPTPSAAEGAIRLGAGASVSAVTTYARLGSKAYKVDTTGAGAREGIRLNSVSGLAYTGSARDFVPSAWLRAPASVQVTISSIIYYTDASFTESTTTTYTLGDSWQLAVAPYQSSNPAKIVDVVWLDVRTVGTVASTFYVDSAQLEQKAYATSYCDGSLGTGYAWSGTAHASSSTRTVTTIKVDETARIATSAGAIVGRVQRLFDPSATVSAWYSGGTGANNDIVQARITTGGTFAGQFYTNNGAGNVFPSPSGSLTLLTWKLLYQQWLGADCGQSIDNGTIATATRGAPGSNGLANANDISIGSVNTGTGQLNGLIGPVAIANRPLTDRERTRLYSATTWTWNMLKSGFRHGKLV